MTGYNPAGRKLLWRFKSVQVGAGATTVVAPADGNRILLRVNVRHVMAAAGNENSSELFLTEATGAGSLGTMNFARPTVELDLNHHGSVVCQSFSVLNNDGTGAKNFGILEILMPPGEQV